MPRTVAPLAAVSAALALSACASRSDTPYRCEGGSVITTHVRGSTMQLELPDTTVTLQRTQTQDGVRYGTGEYTFWMKNDQAMVQQGDLITYRNCLAQK